MVRRPQETARLMIKIKLSYIVGLERTRQVHLLSARGLGHIRPHAELKMLRAFWPARSTHIATSCNNVVRCCVEMLQAFGQAFTLKQGHEINVMQLFLTKTIPAVQILYRFCFIA